MTGGADPVLRVQRRILDEAGHHDVPAEAFGPFRDYDYGDWHTITDARLSNPTPIHDALILEKLAEQGRRSVWERTPDWVFGVAAIVLMVLLALPLVLS